MQRFFHNFPHNTYPYLILYSFDLPTKYNHNRIGKLQKPVIVTYYRFLFC